MSNATPEHGYEENALCGRNGCAGRIEFHPSYSCSCHISPPCSSCTSPRAFCPECGWEEADDPKPDPLPAAKAEPSPWVREWERLRSLPLDNTKVSWRDSAHSSCSMIKEGVYPQTGNDAADREMVRKVVNGTFGGRFESFGGGRFKFIAYTD